MTKIPKDNNYVNKSYNNPLTSRNNFQISNQRGARGKDGDRS